MPGRRRDRRAPAPYPRTARVNVLLREVLAEAIERMADTDDRLRLVTVTAVETTPDLSRATVFLSSMSDDADAALHAARPQLQAAIARQVRMKRTPQLVFDADPSVAHGRRVEEILRHIHEEEEVDALGGAHGEPGATPEDDGHGEGSS